MWVGWWVGELGEGGMYGEMEGMGLKILVVTYSKWLRAWAPMLPML